MNLVERVAKVFTDCLFREDEIGSDGKSKPEAVIIKGIMGTYGLHKDRLQTHKEEVRAILNEMPPEFHKATGGGATFLNLCMDKHGAQWGEHANMEQLVILGMALKMATYSLPKELWSVLPGGMPYVTFDTEG